MASHEVFVSPALSLSPFVPGVSTPTHITFYPGDDALGILWEHGYIELWSLKTRLQPGRGKVMDPSKKWSGWVAKYGESNRFRFRELAVRTINSQNESYIITALGAPCGMADDHVSVTTIEGGLVIRDELNKLPQRNSRLMTPFVPGTYETHNGKVYTCKKYFHEKLSNLNIVSLKMTKRKRNTKVVLPLLNSATTHIKLLHRLERLSMLDFQELANFTFRNPKGSLD
jgi:hypothetical protein